jgi:hypothetical protein
MDVREGERRRINWTPQLAVGVGLAGACLLLWPFAEWDWIPIAIGVGLLILLRLLRLDGLLRGWAPHVVGLVVLVLLVLRTGPWEWALAISLAVLLVGVTQWPRWQLLAVGAVLVVASTSGYLLSQQQARVEQAAAQARQNAITGAFPIEDPKALLRTMMLRIARDDAAGGCAILADPAEAQFAQAAGAPDCPAAIHRLASQVNDPRRYVEPTLPPIAITPSGTQVIVDGCQASWPSTAADPGPRLGRFTLNPIGPVDKRYVVTGYAPCS